MKHPPGCHRISGRTYFTLYAPFASQVRLVLFKNCRDQEPVESLPMRDIGAGFWEYSDIRSFERSYYAYKIDDQSRTIADPYARSVSTYNDFHQEAKAYIAPHDFDWENDRFVTVNDPRDLIIYEAHVKDMTADGSSKVKHPGTYEAMIEKIPYLKKLGINAVELLPLQHFSNYEPPYEEAIHYVKNTWNPYAYNHWGYMTSFFFAPANFYSTEGTKKKDTWSDPMGKEIIEFKSMVKAFHKAGIAVIMDVVYNHIAQYNLNPLRLLAEQHYIDPNANASGCGNDVRSESPIMRRLIIDSVKYWVEEFHIDGYRFDLAGLLDDETLSLIWKTVKSHNPNAILVGEPWGKRYFPQRMSELKFGVWNDVYRNAAKGENPFDRQGYIFGKWDDHLNKDNFFKCLIGSLRKDGGMLPDSRYSVNYLSSHDGYTLGDFIRIASRKSIRAVSDKRDEHLRLDKNEMKISKLAAFILACSQGVMMMHSGQEFSRSKVICEQEGIKDAAVGEMDHDSYNKDNETNYINYRDIEVNRELFDYYRDLISLRKYFKELRSSDRKQITPLMAADNEFGQGYLSHSSSRTFAVLINSSPSQNASFVIDEGYWNIHANEEFASVDARGVLNGGTVELLPRSQLLLIKNNN